MPSTSCTWLAQRSCFGAQRHHPLTLFRRPHLCAQLTTDGHSTVHPTIFSLHPSYPLSTSRSTVRFPSSRPGGRNRVASPTPTHYDVPHMPSPAEGAWNLVIWQWVGDGPVPVGGSGRCLHGIAWRERTFCGAMYIAFHHRVRSLTSFCGEISTVRTSALPHLPIISL